MCSISGITAPQAEIVEKMIVAQRHRAPDEAGIYSDERVALGMGRLKIIDLTSPGLAPYREDNFVLCYNGEIYNYLELKKELEVHGWQFRTTSDTEVLLKAWRQWGTGMFDKLNGMFACAIYDTQKKQLMLARDIAGEKPLYYHHQGKTLTFASEAKALAEVMQVEECEDDFFEAFQHCFITTTWKDVFEVPPAHYLLFDVETGKKEIVEYWKFVPRGINLETVEEELESLLTDAVKLRIRSDVPLGLYFSGGIDSSLVSVLHTFDHQYYFDNLRPELKEEFFSQIPQVLRHLDFPVGSFGFFGMWKLAQAASKDVKVILSGEGADELFGGYVRYLPIAREAELRKSFPSYDYLFGKHFGPTDYVRKFARITSRRDEEKYVSLVEEKVKPYFDMFDDPVSAMGFADFKLIFPSLMQMGDRMAGAFGIENRCPFLDRRLIEFAFSLPASHKIRGLEQKLLLRRLAQRKGLHDAVNMEKRGMSVPFNVWQGSSGWDRSAYFEFLKDTWRKIDRSSESPQTASVMRHPISHDSLLVSSR